MSDTTSTQPGPDLNTQRRLMLLGAVTAATSVAGIALRPGTQGNAQRAPKVDLAAAIPGQFDPWRATDKAVQQVNPETQALLDRLYSQIIERTYVHQDGYAIMLSVSYGADQRGSLEAHKPEVCYPAQGFTVGSNRAEQLATPFGSISVKRLDTTRGARREPLTYWFTVGNSIVLTRVEKRIMELRLALTGQIPDGLLFRVSSIDEQAERGWHRQQQFVNDLLAQCTPGIRARLAGV